MHCGLPSEDQILSNWCVFQHCHASERASVEQYGRKIVQHLRFFNSEKQKQSYNAVYIRHILRKVDRFLTTFFGHISMIHKICQNLHLETNLKLEMHTLRQMDGLRNARYWKSMFVCVCICELMWYVPICAVLWGSLAEDGSPASITAAAPKAGAILPIQCSGSHSAHVHVRPAGPLDGLHLVLHRSKGDRKSRLLGYRFVKTTFSYPLSVRNRWIHLLMLKLSTVWSFFLLIFVVVVVLCL